VYGEGLLHETLFFITNFKLAKGLLQKYLSFGITLNMKRWSRKADYGMKSSFNHQPKIKKDDIIALDG
jgi:hypothetical protein